jgi:putative salt-induced outer membrane protein
MKTTLLASAILLALPITALAADAPPQGWSGSGEAGLSVASGNTKSQNLNAKLNIKFNDEQWKDEFYVTALRNKADTPTGYDLTANRYEAGASMGYKFDERSYIVGAARYEHDEFSPYDYQYIVSVGYGYQILKNASDELAVEVGPGYKVAQPTSFLVPNTSPPPDFIRVDPDSESGLVARGKLDYKHSFSDTVAFVDTFVIESGSDNTFMQNDAGLAVKVNSKLALKVGYQVRHNSDVEPGFKKTDTLMTTNLVYNF